MAKRNAADAQPLRLEWRSPSELAENPGNWKVHPEAQTAALSELIAKVGYAGACLFNEATGRLIDGHARRKDAIAKGIDKIPVLVGRWSEEQERLILATLDPVGAQAEADHAKLAALLAEIDEDSEALAGLLAQADEPTIAALEVKPPPKYTWVLLGIPTVQFGTIAAEVERLAERPEVVLEISSNDGPKD